MLTTTAFVYGLLTCVLGILTGRLFFVSVEESKITRVGFLVVSLGFFILGLGLFSAEETVKVIGTFTVGAGVIVSGLGYESTGAKVLHLILGGVVFIALILRYMI